jgi:hypothetical protein
VRDTLMSAMIRLFSLILGGIPTKIQSSGGKKMLCFFCLISKRGWLGTEILFS